MKKIRVKRSGVFGFFLFFVLGIFLIYLGVLKLNSSKDASFIPEKKFDQKVNFRMINTGKIDLHVEIADNDKLIEKGLSGRNQVSGDGMLFIMKAKEKYGFWMKEMRFDLDMVWISDGEVIGISNAIAPDKKTALSELEIYYPPQPVNMILELPAGKALENEIFVGTKISLI